MEPPLTPLEFARRTRKLYPERKAVVDGDLRLNYEQLFSRCDRWSAADAVNQDLGLKRLKPSTRAKEAWATFPTSPA
jgi:fatty-acyl-CoA synthase